MRLFEIFDLIFMARIAILKLGVLLALALVSSTFVFSIFVRADDTNNEAFKLDVPLGIPADLWSYYIPKDNPLTTAKVNLGRQLFFDKRLSADASVSCATCHDPKLAFTDGRNLAVGIGNRVGRRNSPTLLNAMFVSGQFWDGRVDSLEAQAKLPLIESNEMGNESLEQVAARLEAVPEYARQFREVFGGPVTVDFIAKAIASFERTLVSANSPLDRFVNGDRDALSESARRGFVLFRTKGRCTICHNLNQAFPFLTDQNFRNTGVAANSLSFDRFARTAMRLSKSADLSLTLKGLAAEEGAAELGRFLVTGSALDIGTFRTPSLRNVELTAPYFHDGSAATLGDVLRFYIKGGNENPSKDWELQPLDLSDDEQHDLIEFLKSLTSDDARQTSEIAASLSH